MLETLKYLLNISSEANVNIDLQKLFFSFDSGLCFVVSYEKDANIEEENTWSVSENELITIVNSNIKNVAVVYTEYLGYRENIPEYNEPKSKSFYLFETLKKIEKTNPNIVEKYCIVDDYRYDMLDGFGCPDEPNYGYIIYLNRKYWEQTDIYNFFIHDKLINISPPIFYWRAYQNYEKPIPDSGKIKILTTNTKTRRLGYFSILAVFFSQQKKISSTFFNKKFESYAATFSSQINSYKNSKGEIKITKTGNSAKHYLELAKELEFVNALNRIYSVGKRFKVYLVLKDYYKVNKNIFELSFLDKVFFLETLLEKDYLYITWLIELIYVQGRTNYRKLNSTFQSFLVERTIELLNSNQTKFNFKLRRELTKIKERIIKWEKPETYLEHVIMPRINWLYDLGFIRLDEKLNIELTEIGKRFFCNICYLVDIKTDRFINFETALNAFYIHFFNDVYFIDDKNQQDVALINKKIEEYLVESFDYFKTIAPNRVTASQAILFVKYKLYLTDQIKVEYTYIKKTLENNTLPKFIFKFQKKYGDGYIQIK